MEKQILLIEDDRLVAKSLSDLLTFNGFKVWIAPDGDLAIKLAESKDFDLIISDIRMPGMFGTEVVKKINGNRPNPLPFIFITGYADDKYVREAEDMGCNDFFLKPFDTSNLVRSLRRILNLPVEMTSYEKPVIRGHAPPSTVKRFFYNALGSQWNPEKEIDWNGPLGLNDSQCHAMARILSPIVMGEYSAFDGLPRRILSFTDYEAKQYLASQLVDETRHAEAFDLYLKRIGGIKEYKQGLRNIYALRFFNVLKKMTDDDEWLVGLYLTEVMAHILLTSYSQSASCVLTQHLFKMILSDEARHISFVHYYLGEILKRASKDDQESMDKLMGQCLELAEGLVYSYTEPAKIFNIDSKAIFDQIAGEINIRFKKNLLRADGSLRG